MIRTIEGRRLPAFLFQKFRIKKLIVFLNDSIHVDIVISDFGNAKKKSLIIRKD